ncbi:MAG: hypothetical protein JO163_04800, partial [Methylobacteriaceae bacterium]|nr:hypothetical protein [Methylobacteriaceae bacterium]
MTRILHRAIGSPLPVAAIGSGMMVRDTDGKDYIDGSGGAASPASATGTPTFWRRCMRSSTVSLM